MKYFKLLSLAILSFTLVTACADDSDTETMENEENTEMMESGNESMNDGAMEDAQSIVALASENQDLSTLTKALNAADRVQMLKSEGPYTVFAPTNDAFDALPEGTVSTLMKSENKQKLTNILAYHVVEGNMMASKLKDGQTLTTVQGNTLTVSKKDGAVMVNGVKVAKADIKASNGVVHVIDKVLMPSN